ncbi:MAG: hypothetical protein P4N60_11225 [Verrucomicrobiae bacterium]|nr:hypothetical protein [Verrucomicrobiae bacterium]
MTRPLIILLLLIGGMLSAQPVPMPVLAAAPVKKFSTVVTAKPAAQLIAKPAAVVLTPPPSLTVTSSLPVMFMVSPDLTAPFTRTGSVTNRLHLNADQARQFFQAVLENFPVTNLNVGVSWHPVAVAARYRIYFGAASSNYTQVVELPAPATNYATTIWRAYATNFCTMTCLDSNGVESAYANEIRYVPQFSLNIFRN